MRVHIDPTFSVYCQPSTFHWPLREKFNSDSFTISSCFNIIPSNVYYKKNYTIKNIGYVYTLLYSFCLLPTIQGPSTGMLKRNHLSARKVGRIVNVKNEEKRLFLLFPLFFRCLHENKIIGNKGFFFPTFSLSNLLHSLHPYLPTPPPNWRYN